MWCLRPAVPAKKFKYTGCRSASALVQPFKILTATTGRRQANVYACGIKKYLSYYFFAGASAELAAADEEGGASSELAAADDGEAGASAELAADI